MTSVQIRPGTYYEGAERQLEVDISEANSAARNASDLLDFDVASLAPEVDQAPALKHQLQDEEPQRAERDRDDGDDFFDDPLRSR